MAEQEIQIKINSFNFSQMGNKYVLTVEKGAVSGINSLKIDGVDLSDGL